MKNVLHLLYSSVGTVDAIVRYNIELLVGTS